MKWQDFLECEAKFKRGETMFVRFLEGARTNSVARVITWDYTVEVGWDDRPNTFSTSYKNLELARLNVGTHWEFQRNRVEDIPAPTDSLGQSFAVGDIVLYRSKKSNYFGVVEEIKPSGGIHVKRSGLINPSYKDGKVERIYDRMDAIIISDNIKNVLMRKKLSMP